MANRHKYLKLLLLVVIALSLGSCGLFKKKCDCPTFGGSKKQSMHWR
jgi:hypothetical protein